MQKGLQSEVLDKMMKRLISRNKIKVIYLDMIKESFCLYDMKLFAYSRISADTSQNIYLVIFLDIKMMPTALEFTALSGVNIVYVQICSVFRLIQEEKVRIVERWEIISGCKDFGFLFRKASFDVLDLFESQIKKYLYMSELPESYFNEVPRSVCWYEGLISTEMLLMEIEELKVI